MAAHPPIGDPRRGWVWWTSGSSGTLKVMSIRTIVTADVDQGQAQELVGAFRTLLAGGLPDGLLETQLLGDGEGHWAIHSLWRDQAALDAMRAASEPPAAPALFRRFSAEPALVVMPVLVDSRDTR
ncbi:Antibiotic biosynthesis monooxygenase [Pedococcus cremeus]|uniref:Antibiotic biosynthesis monooxygenase n=2 Tax=Pedococcus cremeus TaxID=587636 RepID=A0A1H9TGI8_9MICO|nr:Antibiotic biosynthesis monooxygenase [Pedococcus cremeus]